MSKPAYTYNGVYETFYADSKRLNTDQVLALLNAYSEVWEALMDRQRAAHNHGMGWANAVALPPSHSDPMEECESPGCVRASAALQTLDNALSGKE